MLNEVEEKCRGVASRDAPELNLLRHGGAALLNDLNESIGIDTRRGMIANGCAPGPAFGGRI